LAARTLIAALGLLLTHAVPMHAGVDRPPQFIVMAFDNCTELERWQELTDFAAEMNRRRRPRSLHLLRQRDQFHRRRQAQHLRGSASAPRLFPHQFRRLAR